MGYTKFTVLKDFICAARLLSSIGGFSCCLCVWGVVGGVWGVGIYSCGLLGVSRGGFGGALGYDSIKFSDFFDIS